MYLQMCIRDSYITRPIVQLSGISQRMANLDFSYKCQEKRGDEIGVLGRNLNELSERLSTSLNDLREANCALRQDIDRERELEKQRTTFFSAASHELKTPITVLKGQLSGMLAGVDIYKDQMCIRDRRTFVPSDALRGVLRHEKARQGNGVPQRA